jgi:hypothetical protein
MSNIHSQNLKSDSMPKIVRLDEQELLELTKEVKETIASHVTPAKKAKKRYTAAQLWKHHRNSRTASLWTRNSNSPIHLY